MTKFFTDVTSINLMKKLYAFKPDSLSINFLFFELKFVGHIVVPVVFDFVFTLQPANDNPGANTCGLGKSEDIFFIKSPPLDEGFLYMRGD